MILFSILDYMLGSLTNALEFGLREALRDKYQEAMDPYLFMMDVWLMALDGVIYHQTEYGSAAMMSSLRLDKKVLRWSITDADASEMSEIQKDPSEREVKPARVMSERIPARMQQQYNMDKWTTFN